MAKAKEKPQRVAPSTSGTSDDDAFRASLSRHGDAFLSLFDDDAPPVSKKRKLEEDVGGDRPAKKITFVRQVVNADSSVAGETPMKESAPASKPKRTPIVVEYHRNGVARQPADAMFAAVIKKEKKMFMSEKIDKVHADPVAALLQDAAARKNEGRDASDELDVDVEKIAREVQLLGATGLSKREAKELKIRRIMALGGAAPAKPRAPFKISKGMQAKQKEREAKRAEQERITGVVTGAVKALSSDKTATPAPKGKGRWVEHADGLKPGVGRFKGGMLVLNKKEIRSLSAPPPAAVDKKRGKHDKKRSKAKGRGKR